MVFYTMISLRSVNDEVEHQELLLHLVTNEDGHVVFQKSVGKGCHFRQEPLALRCCIGLGGPES